MGNFEEKWRVAEKGRKGKRKRGIGLRDCTLILSGTLTTPRRGKIPDEKKGKLY